MRPGIFTSSIEIGGHNIPVWILTLFLTALAIVAAIGVIMLVKKGDSDDERDQSESREFKDDLSDFAKNRESKMQ